MKRLSSILAFATLAAVGGGILCYQLLIKSPDEVPKIKVPVLPERESAGSKLPAVTGTVESLSSDAWKAALAAFKENAGQFDKEELKKLAASIPRHESAAWLDLLNFLPLGKDFGPIRRSAMRNLAHETPALLLNWGNGAGREERAVAHATLFSATPPVKLIPLLITDTAHLPPDAAIYLRNAAFGWQADYYCDNPAALDGLPGEFAAAIRYSVVRNMMGAGPEKEQKVSRFIEQLSPAAVEMVAAEWFNPEVNDSRLPTGQHKLTDIERSGLGSSAKSALTACVLLTWSHTEMDQAAKWIAVKPDQEKNAIVSFLKTLDSANTLLDQVKLSSVPH